MFRTIVTTLLMIEGGIFLAAGLTPGVPEQMQAVLSQHPDLIPPDKLNELMQFITLVQRIAAGFGLACLVGGFGAARNAVWGRWLSVAVSVVNLLAPPLLTPLGIAGLIVLLRKPEKPEGDAGPQGAAPAAKPEPVSHVLVMIASLALVVYISHAIRGFAAGRGLPVGEGGRLDLLWIMAGQLVFTLFHELGHLLAAWAVGFRFHEINVGPFTLTQRNGEPWNFRFDWQKILRAGGYLQAIPVTTKDLRMNWILVVVAGPAASLFLGMIGFLVLVSLPGTALAVHWEWAAFITSICTADCIANLLPLGLTDGALLLHTGLQTKRGKGILAGLEAAMLNDKADRDAATMDPAELVETRRKALEQLEKSAESSALARAAQRIEFAQAALRNGDAETAAEALEESGKALAGLSGVPALIWFRFHLDSYQTETARRRFTQAAAARAKALEFGDQLGRNELGWDDLAGVRVACARLMMSERDHIAAIQTLREIRESCPSRGDFSARAAELLVVEAECEIQLGRPEAAETLTAAAIDIAQALSGGKQAGAMEVLGNAAVRFSESGDYGFADALFRVAVEGLEAAPAPVLAAGFRTSWAESLYQNGKLAESKAVLEPVNPEGLVFSSEIETLRAQLLLAEDRPAEAAAVLEPLTSAGAEGEKRQREVARSRALRALALYQSGGAEQALADARGACDVLMPLEHPDAAPALLTLAIAVGQSNADLAEAYLQESTRLICDTTLLSGPAKAGRLMELARGAVQARRRDWGKRLLDDAQVMRGRNETYSFRGEMAAKVEQAAG